MQGPIRQYGHELGFTSFTQVSRGIYTALSELGLLGGFLPLDCFDEEEHYDGASCPVGLNTGMPSGVALSKMCGNHSERWLLLAPNSDKVPENYHRWLPDLVTALLAPSWWAASVLTELFPEIPCHRVPHGVSTEFFPVLDARERRKEEYLAGDFKVLHMTSTNSQRKGTKLLVQAWAELEREWRNGSLMLVCRYDGYPEVMKWVAEQGAMGIHVIPSDGANYDTARAMYSSVHVLCQPSRAEGFGLCPLEAKACAVPAVMTACTGHADHFQSGAAVEIPTGPPEDLDDVPGSKAPAVAAVDIKTSLRRARSDWLTLQARAGRTASSVAAEWAWRRQSGEAIRRILRTHDFDQRRMST